MILAKPSVPVIRPNWRRFPNSVFGALNLGVLVAFKASRRNETRVFSVRFTAFRTERSMLARPGPRQSPRRRGAFPSVYVEAAEKAVPLNQSPILSWGLPEVHELTPATRCGRC